MPATLPQVAPDIGPILALVRKTRLLLRSSWVIVGVGLTVGLAFASLAVITAADLLFPLVGPWLRLAGLVLFAVPTVLVFIWTVVLPLGRRLRNVELARRIESKIPGMHSRLVSCIDLAGREGQVSPAFYRKLVNESLNRIDKYRAASVIDWRAIRKAVTFAAAGVGLFLLLWLALGSALTTALARVFQPFADIPPASDVAFTVEPETTRVLRGDAVTFAAAVTRGDPDSLTLELTGADATVRYPLEKGPDGVWRRTLRGLSAERGFEDGFTYRVFGGRTWTRESRIDWAARPVIAGSAVVLHYPEYMGIPGPRVSSRDVTGPTGSRVEIVVATEGDVVAGTIHLTATREPPNAAREALALIAPAALALSVESERVDAGPFPLRPVGDGTWTGTFPLDGSGRYRIELRNELGHANQPASEDPRYESIADQPPVVQIDRPGAELVLSKPDKVPLQVAARDDFGLGALWLKLNVQKPGAIDSSTAVLVKHYPSPNPPRADVVVYSLDLGPTGLNLRPGDLLRYRFEVSDRRPNSPLVPSKEYTVRIAEDPNAADKQLEAFEKGQDTVRDKLVQLIGEQRKVKKKIDQVQAKYDALNTKVQSAVEEAKARGKPRDEPLPQLDPKDAREMENLRKELAELVGHEQKNLEAATRLDQELKNLAAQAQKSPLLNGAINKEMQDLSARFKNAALDPLADLASQLQQGATADKSPPDLRDTKARSDRVQKNLESLQSRMDALAQAQQGLKTDAEKALARLKEELLKEHGKMTARDLEELKEFLKNLRQELAKHQGKQEDLADKTEKAPDSALPEFEGKQASLDELLKKDLDLAKKILEKEKARRLTRPDSSDDPSRAEPKARKGAPKEDDTSPEPRQKKDTPGDDLLKPALGGESQKLDPRFEKKLKPTPRKKGDNSDAADRRDALRNHQQDNLRDLDAAQKALASDEQSLEEMIQSLMDAARKGQPGAPNDSNTSAKAADELMKMLRSEALKNATQMASRAKQGRQGHPNQPGDQPPAGTAADSLIGNSVSGPGILDELDPRTRATILQLPPRVREELLQGMKAQGPEGYQKFIQDYFRRLSEVPK
jgi:cell division septum initiation protein DivIVA